MTTSSDSMILWHNCNAISPIIRIIYLLHQELIEEFFYRFKFSGYFKLEEIVGQLQHNRLLKYHDHSIFLSTIELPHLFYLYIFLKLSIYRAKSFRKILYVGFSSSVSPICAYIFVSKSRNLIRIG